MNKLKNTFKQLTVWALILLFALSAVSCTSDKPTGIGGVTGVTGEGQKDIVPKDTGSSDTVADSTADSTTGSSSGDETSPTIEEFVCMEYDGLKVTAKEIVNDSFWGRTGIKFRLENESNKNYNVGVSQAIINNCMVGSIFSCAVSAGKKANDTLYFYANDLEEAGITQIGQIELYFYVYDDTSYTRLYESECVTIRTTFYDEALNVPSIETGYSMYDGNNVKISGMYVDEDTLLGKSIMLCIENNRTEDICVSVEDFSINGYTVTEWFSKTVYAGKYIIGAITVSNVDLEENEIETIEDFEVVFKIYNPHTYETIVTTEILSFVVQS